MRKDFLGPLSAHVRRVCVKRRLGEKPDPPDRTPQGVLEKRPEFPAELWWRRGELKTLTRENPVGKGSSFKGFSPQYIPQHTVIYR
jgi:hypothetical protein